ncbi:hypothetical protein [Sinomonas halotolerans]|uniref:Lipoprotein n=1 Tax=Sinomonas halotolerans TaxID=1644133 RepID=A0ABU9WX81_9MICC
MLGFLPLALAMALSGCVVLEPRPCPAIAAAPFVTIEVPTQDAESITALWARACQGTNCREDRLELLPADPYGDPGQPRVAHLDMGVLTEEQIALTVRVMESSTTGRPGPTALHRLDFTPIAEYPFGEHCGKFIRAVVVLDSQGLHAKP